MAPILSRSLLVHALRFQQRHLQSIHDEDSNPVPAAAAHHVTSFMIDLVTEAAQQNRNLEDPGSLNTPQEGNANAHKMKNMKKHHHMKKKGGNNKEEQDMYDDVMWGSLGSSGQGGDDPFGLDASPFGAGGFGDEDPFGGLGGAFDVLEQCDLDIGEIMTLGMSLGGAPGGPGNGISPFPQEGGMPMDPAAAAAMMEAAQEMMASLAKEGEVECTDVEEKAFEAEIDTFLSCTGWDKIYAPSNIDEFQSFSEEMEEKCTPSLDFDPMQAMQAQSQTESNGISDIVSQDCIDLLLGSNPIGDLFRNVYTSPDTICSCTESFHQSLPTCIIPGGVPLSILKSATCLVGVGCDALDGILHYEQEILSSCLPPPSDKSVDCDDIQTRCADSVLLAVPYEISMGQLPDYSGDNPEVSDAFAFYNRKCSAYSSTPPEWLTDTASQPSSNQGFNYGILLGLAGGCMVMVVVALLSYRRRPVQGTAKFQAVDNDCDTTQASSEMEFA